MPLSLAVSHSNEDVDIDLNRIRNTSTRGADVHLADELSCMRLLFAFLLCGFVRCAFVDGGLTMNASTGIVSCCVRRRGEGRRRGGGGMGIHQTFYRLL